MSNINSKKFQNRINFFNDKINAAVNEYSYKFLKKFCYELKRNNLKFEVPSKPELHTGYNWNIQQSKDDIIKSKFINVKEFRDLLFSCAMSSIIYSKWFQGESENDGDNICMYGPCICTFKPLEKRVYIDIVVPYIMWPVDYSKLPEYKNEMELRVKVMNNLINKEVVDALVDYSIFNNDYDFDQHTDNEYLDANNAIEEIVDSIESLSKPGMIERKNNGFILLTLNSNQCCLIYSIMTGRSYIEIPDMIRYRDKQWLDEHNMR